jgi:hypothetical protein
MRLTGDAPAVARQIHIANYLERLGSRAFRQVHFSLKGSDRGRALWRVTYPSGDVASYETPEIEALIGHYCRGRDIVWLPVPHPGGVTQLEETFVKIEEVERRRGSTRQAR